MSKTKVAVIGVGYHGRHHARILSGMDGVELVAVVDASEQTVNTVAAQHRTTGLTDYRSLLGQVDAVSVAVPTVAHFPVAKYFLEAGVAAFVEKPLAFSVEDAREIVRIADRKNAVLQVGHVERFNPAWSAVERRKIDASHIQATRLSRYPFRCLDVSVVFDVMIHDIDLVLSAVNSPIEHLDATGERVLSPSLDMATAWIHFANGTRATISASRVHHEPVRQVRILGRETMMEVDLLRRTTTTQQLRPDLPAEFAQGAFPVTLTNDDKSKLLEETFAIERSDYQTTEPLKLELDEFIRCVRTGDTPRVTGDAGYQAVAVASRIELLIADANQSEYVLRRSA